jgi:hypothetical protein
MKKMAIGFFAALMAAVVPAPALAAADPKPAPAIETPEDVVIRAKRMKLYEMRMEMVEVEDKFYAKYNELNTDDDYDVLCSFVSRTGEIRKTRRCEPVFVEKLKGQYAAEVLQLFQGGPHSPVSPDNELFSRWLVLQERAKGVINKSPELRKLIRHREALEKGYREEQKVRLKGRVVLLE